MPTLTPDRLFQRAIRFAVLDRDAMVDAYRSTGPEAESAKVERDAIEAFTGRKLASLNAEELKMAFRTFVYAEQWVGSLADSNPGKAVERQARSDLRYFQAFRRHVWGKSALEQAIEGGTTVTVYPPSKVSDALFDSATGRKPRP